MLLKMLKENYYIDHIGTQRKLLGKILDNKKDTWYIFGSKHMRRNTNVQKWFNNLVQCKGH